MGQLGRLTRDGLAARLSEAGFLAPGEEADELVAAAGGDPARLDLLARRRLTGEPLAWVTGTVVFCELELRVHPGVYVPRWQTEPLALRAAALLPDLGVAIDVCTGTGAVARTMLAARPGATVAATDVDRRAVDCARANGVDAVLGDLFDPLPASLEHRTDVITGAVPYVPTAELRLLQRDTFTFETPLAYDGGADGADLLRRAAREARRFLRPGGVLLLELGGDQAGILSGDLERLGYARPAVLRDEEGDVRGIEAAMPQPSV